MSRSLVRAWCLCLAMGCWAVGVSSAAQPVYRCGSSYSAVQCPGGQLVDATDPRTPEQRAAAQRATEAERRRGAAMERERLADDARHPPANAATLGAGPAPVVAAASAAPNHKPKKLKVKRPVKPKPKAHAAPTGGQAFRSN